jgi:hypothetical protein
MLKIFRVTVAAWHSLGGGHMKVFRHVTHAHPVSRAVRVSELFEKRDPKSVI